MNNVPGSEYAVGFVFAVAVLATIAGASLAALATRIIRGVCGLALCCFGLAGLYYFLHAPFLSLMEILIYVGAICVTIIFAVMLAEPDEAPARESRNAAIGWGALALAISGAVFWGVAKLGISHAWLKPEARASAGSLKDMGVALLTTYSFAFELISLVLLVAILGALVIARYGRTKP
jgi:NADH:ubiquinone oxidoreductase subunit 6 (subunit J)